MFTLHSVNGFLNPSSRSSFPNLVQVTIGGFHVTSLPPCWWTVNKRSLISSLCLSTSIFSFHHCYLCLPRLHENHLYVLELTVGFESNLYNNAVRKKEKYLNLIKEMRRNYRYVRFVNLSMSSLGVFSDDCSTFLDMMNDIGIDKKQQRYIIKKMINIAIRATYYIFCCRNRNWDSPDLMQF